MTGLFYLCEKEYRIYIARRKTQEQWSFFKLDTQISDLISWCIDIPRGSLRGMLS